MPAGNDNTIRSFAKRCIPPILIDCARYSSRRTRKNEGVVCRTGGEQDASWYDESFENASHWRHHYTASRYYFFWSVLVDRIIRNDKQKVLDIGCGPGQFACLARDRGVNQYWGLDFSNSRIEQAQLVCPEFEFFSEDAFVTNKFDSLQYDAVIMTEVLEHVDGDLDLLGRIRPGTFFLGSVPNFPYASHVRHFENACEVKNRYTPYLSDIRVDTMLADEKGKLYFLIEGTTT